MTYFYPQSSPSDELEPNTWEDGKRITTVHDRYQVGDPINGQVECYLTFDAAQTCAINNHRILRRQGETVTTTIFDRMARRGKVNLWQVTEDGALMPIGKRELQ